MYVWYRFFSAGEQIAVMASLAALLNFGFGVLQFV
ncbi:hypothetical protein swp_2984 [Shewanella piezotolerans WP3]|uniref:Uncharacterized protein n=1 Tax=Shewanella piezotolerans (strain WP3 / JCM 13877) TaxID=225849 RepID=B8CR32_SHEPW|nr:hypothetical protein swp_2984 [Shewanella piezotolerans WP3]